jgi:hypothetical protein
MEVREEAVKHNDSWDWFAESAFIAHGSSISYPIKLNE